ncbi:MAG TPA: carboxyl transferase domain-containing protein, partial [Planctomycetaceae bacterium]|nr:carboxyl transferase domain-containing protein [Planctomycetaceae bacterium]
MLTLRELAESLQLQEEPIREGGSAAGRERQHRLGRLTARERLRTLLDPEAPIFELGLWAAWQMYSDVGDVPAAGVVTVLSTVQGRPVLVVANDATVKAGSFFPQTVKKVLRAQRIAMHFRLPLVYLVDSAGVFLPMQDEIFPDEDDFGRIFRNNAVISAMGIPQYAAVLGNCVAGGAYLPVLCDTLLMTEGSQMSLAGPALVKAAIGQTVDPEELGGARMHATVSGTADYYDRDDESCLTRLRSLIDLLPQPRTQRPSVAAARNPEDVYDIVPGTQASEFDMRDLLACVVDAGSLQEFRADYGKTVVTAFARIGGHPVGIVANQRNRTLTATHRLQIGGVLYEDGAEKAARFVMDCNQQEVPLVF